MSKIVLFLRNYKVPSNLNYFYLFGSILLMLLAIQVMTGFWLTLFYIPTAREAFDSIQTIMRDVNYGWLFRYMHTTGASLLFIMLYLHLFRGLLYGSYQSPRERVWIFGFLLFILLSLEAALGYLLPWGQLSYWGAQVMTSLVGALPYVGDQLLLLIRGDYVVSDITLRRFFAFHILAVPFLIGCFIVFHIRSLWSVGANNPTGKDLPPSQKIPFHPYYTLKDSWGTGVALLLFFTIVLFFPTMGGYFIDADNAEKANPLLTPASIKPLWYLAPFYAMLRAIPSKGLGMVTLIASFGLWFILPWLDQSVVRTLRQKNLFFKIACIGVIVSFLGLGWLGLQELSPVKLIGARILTGLYFAYFIFMPWYSR